MSTIRTVLIESKIEVLERLQAHISGELETYREMLAKPEEPSEDQAT